MNNIQKLLLTLILCHGLAAHSKAVIYDKTCELSVPQISLAAVNKSFGEFLAYRLKSLFSNTSDQFLYLNDQVLYELFQKGYYPKRITSSSDYDKGLLLNWQFQCPQKAIENKKIDENDCLYHMSISRDLDGELKPIYFPRKNQVSHDISDLLSNIPNCAIK